jgi:hypothetical protein
LTKPDVSVGVSAKREGPDTVMFEGFEERERKALAVEGLVREVGDGLLDFDGVQGLCFWARVCMRRNMARRPPGSSSAGDGSPGDALF